MAKKWTIEENGRHFFLLNRLYIKENKTIGEIGKLLNRSEQTIFGRLKRLGIKTIPQLKPNYPSKERNDIKIPRKYNETLAEFFGIMLGDGHLSHYQIVVTLGSKEVLYVNYVVDLIEKLFGVRPKIGIRKNEQYRDIYLGSKALSRWLTKEGLVYNKVLSQVDVPRWIFKKKLFMTNFLRGFFDTDGSIYKLRWGKQISFTNRSIPLLKSTRKILINLGHSPSLISTYALYLTKKKDIATFLRDIQPKNPKHLRFWAGT